MLASTDQTIQKSKRTGYNDRSVLDDELTVASSILPSFHPQYVIVTSDLRTRFFNVDILSSTAALSSLILRRARPEIMDVIDVVVETGLLASDT